MSVGEENTLNQSTSLLSFNTDIATISKKNTLPSPSSSPPVSLSPPPSLSPSSSSPLLHPPTTTTAPSLSKSPVHSVNSFTQSSSLFPQMGSDLGTNLKPQHPHPTTKLKTEPKLKLD
ncbi:unnamed protein product [Lactuca saligna]|uniref:Uncharacterized protein n=1 Tax=Lactuca saligna TaxID=75948 RepID=A0AA36EJ39_LACSI|nr:unnamed protein product [Lactuca saligna]